MCFVRDTHFNSDSSSSTSDCLSTDEGYSESYSDYSRKDFDSTINDDILNNTEMLTKNAISQTDNSILIKNNTDLVLLYPNFYEHPDLINNNVVEIFQLFYERDFFLYNFLKNIWAYDEILLNEELTYQTNYNNMSDSVDIQAYLYEIDLNVEYFQNDCQESDIDNSYNNIDSNIDKMLSFNFADDACNMLLYCKYITMQQSLLFFQDYIMEQGNGYKFELCDMFAHIEYIPEFYPVTTTYDMTRSNSGLNEYVNHFHENGSIIIENSIDVNGDIFENVYNYSADAHIDSNEAFIHIDLKSHLTLHTDEENLPSSSSTMNNITFMASTVESEKDMCDIFRKPCVYMLNEGRCMRSDCRFAHDIHQITCRYWLEGGCLKGDSCEFLHDFPNTQMVSSEIFCSNKICDSNGDDAKDFSLNKSEFPELGVSLNYTRCKSFNNDDTENNTNQANCSENVDFTETDKKNENNICNGVDNVKQGFSSNKKSRKFRDNVLYSLSLPGTYPGILTNMNRKKNIN